MVCVSEISGLLKILGAENKILVPKIYTYPELQNGIELGNEKVIVTKIDLLARTSRVQDLSEEFYRVKALNKEWYLQGKWKVNFVYRDWSFLYGLEVQEPWIAEKELKLTGNNVAFATAIHIMQLHCLHIQE